MILPEIRDPAMVTIRRGGTLADDDHRLLALWAADCADHVLYLFECERPEDTRPRNAVTAARAWAAGTMEMMQARALGGHAMGAARPLEGRGTVRSLFCGTDSMCRTCGRARSWRGGLCHQGNPQCESRGSACGPSRTRLAERPASRPGLSTRPQRSEPTQPHLLVRLLRLNPLKLLKPEGLRRAGEQERRRGRSAQVFSSSGSPCDRVPAVPLPEPSR